MAVSYPALVPARGQEVTDQHVGNWTDDINDLNARLSRFEAGHDVVELEPTGNIDTGASAAFTTWITLDPVTVPDWASQARYLVTVSGMLLATNVKAGFTRLNVGGAISKDHGIDMDSTTIRQDVVWSGRITGLATGTATVTIEFSSATGTGTFRVDANSHIAATLAWEA